MRKSMRTIRFPGLLFMVVMLVSGCSSSSDTAPINSESELVTTVTETVNDAGTNDVNNTDSTTIDQGDVASISVEFNITVPAYQSNALLIRVEWGDKSLNANWQVDEVWAVSDEFPTNVESRLIVSFYDQNGAITLGRYEANFKTGVFGSQVVTVTADQFNTAQWDDDNDGIANLDELIAGSYSLVDNGSELIPPEPVQVNLELVQDKTFRFSWQASSAASYYRLLEDVDGVSGFTQVGDDIDSSLLQYDHRVALYRRMNADYIVQACNTHSCVDSLEVAVPDSLSQAVGYFKATTDNPNNFGRHVAISADGNTFAVAGTHEIYVFGRENGTWQQQANLTESESVFESGISRVLSLSGNGDVLVVGASEEALVRPEGEAFQSGDQRAGAVYLYYRENEQWIYQARLVSNDISGGHQFGTSVSLSTDGRMLAVGAPDASVVVDGTIEQGGVTYLFEQNDGNWRQQQYVRADGGSFGSSVKFSHDGTTLAVGAMHHERSGSAYVFAKTDMGWQQQAFLKADDADAGDWFGASITVDATGSLLAVGAPFFNFGDPSLNGPIGATYVFRKIDDMWQQEARLNAVWLGDAFGSEVALSGDGNTLMISSQGASNNGIGFVAVYVWLGDNWIEQTRVIASNAERSDQFADSLGLSNDGNTLVVGAPSENSSAQGISGDQADNSRGNIGAAYLF